MGLDQVIGKNIKAFREHLNYTQQEISDYLGISQPAYVKYEKGETVVPLRQWRNWPLCITWMNTI